MLLDNDLKTEKMEQMEKTYQEMEEKYQKMKQTYQDGRWVISPNDQILSSKTGSLSREMSVDQISNVLGFEPNHPDDHDKVEYSWGATVYDTVTGESTDIAIWDYYGARWSTYGDQDVIEQVFTCSS